jgi:hypothetical protein
MSNRSQKISARLLAPSLPFGFLLSRRQWVSVDGSDGSNLHLGAPDWFLALIFAALPLVMLRRWWIAQTRIRRVKRGLCVACGYDLRGTLERCPECGATAGV